MHRCSWFKQLPLVVALLTASALVSAENAYADQDEALKLLKGMSDYVSQALRS
jgi:hypothetical protein